jgi:hypothetical protein
MAMFFRLCLVLSPVYPSGLAGSLCSSPFDMPDLPSGGLEKGRVQGFVSWTKTILSDFVTCNVYSRLYVLMDFDPTRVSDSGTSRQKQRVV